MIQISFSLPFGSSTEQLGDSRRGKEAFIDCGLSLSVTATSTARAREVGRLWHLSHMDGSIQDSTMLPDEIWFVVEKIKVGGVDLPRPRRRFLLRGFGGYSR